MDGGPRFYHFSVTINEHLILDILDGHGDYVLHGSEAALARRFRSWDGACKFADVLSIFRNGHRDYVIGIEVKDWQHNVTPKLCRDYLETYRKSCEYFYIAARRFSPGVFKVKGLGVIDLDNMLVLKSPEYLFPEPELRAGVVERLLKHNDIGREVIAHPFQRSLRGWGQSL